MEHIVEMLDLVSGNLSQVAKSEVVVGDPIELDGVTIVPLSRVSVGMGGGGGEGEGDFHGPGHKSKDKKKCPGGGTGKGGGTGGGAKVRPVGVIVFSEDGVEVQAIKEKKGVLDKIFERVPEIMDLVKQAQDKKSAGS